MAMLLTALQLVLRHYRLLSLLILLSLLGVQTYRVKGLKHEIAQIHLAQVEADNGILKTRAALASRRPDHNQLISVFKDGKF